MLVVHNVQYVYNVQYNGEYKSLDLADITSLYLPYYCQDPGPGPLGNLCIVVIINFNHFSVAKATLELQMSVS